MKRAPLVQLPFALVAAVLALSGSVHAMDSSSPAVKPEAAVLGNQAIAGDAIVVKVLSSAECVNTPPTIVLIKDTAQELSLRVDIARQVVRTQEEADQFRFFGSPTVQFDGLDLETEMRKSTRHVLS